MFKFIKKLSVSKEYRKILDVIDKSTVKKALSKTDDIHMSSETQYTIENADMTITATRKWHHAQGSDFSFNIMQTNPNNPSDVKYRAEIFNDMDEAQKTANTIFTAMQDQYLKQCVAR